MSFCKCWLCKLCKSKYFRVRCELTCLTTVKASVNRPIQCLVEGRHALFVSTWSLRRFKLNSPALVGYTKRWKKGSGVSWHCSKTDPRGGNECLSVISTQDWIWTTRVWSVVFSSCQINVSLLSQADEILWTLLYSICRDVQPFSVALMNKPGASVGFSHASVLSALGRTSTTSKNAHIA